MNNASIRTVLGVFDVAYTERGVCELRFPAAHRQRSTSTHNAASLPTPIRHVAVQIVDYARGRSLVFRVDLDFAVGTEFQRKVWRTLQSIPRGQTRSYGWVAKQIGHPRSARAVGRACGANPVPIIVPCHRVTAADGSLGGYSSGLAWKKRLLALEGVDVSTCKPRSVSRRKSTRESSVTN
jgi:O-6-methylguanine DNA methyltransferase